VYFQGTIKNEVTIEGIGLHTGKKSRVRILPAAANTGIIFTPMKKGEGIATDSNAVKAEINNILETNNALTIGNNNFQIKTIEHFLAAFFALGITNIIVMVDGEEMPILDGSSMGIVDKIETANIEAQSPVCTPIYIPYPVWVEMNGSYLIALPSSNFKITYTIDFTTKSRAVGTQTAQYLVTADIFRNEIASARTFGFYEDIEKLRKYNLAQGGSVDNALIFTRYALINDSLRYDDECVRHKILDLIGDLATLGRRINAHFIAYKSGHTLDIKLVKKIVKSLRRTRNINRVPAEIIKEKHKAFYQFKRRINL